MRPKYVTGALRPIVPNAPYQRKAVMSDSMLSKLKEGQVPEPVRQSAARGVLPVGPEELLAILIFLQNDPDPEIRRTAQETLSREFNSDLLKTIVESSSTPIDVLEYFGTSPHASSEIIEILIQNKSTPDSTIASLAERVDAGLMGVILVNLMRILRSPFILEALERNSNSTPDLKRQLKEIREEFFEKRNTFIPIHRTRAEIEALDQGRESSSETSEDEGPTALPVYSGEIREGEDVAALTLESLSDDGLGSWEDEEEEERLTAIQKIARMTVAERVQTALKGTREERVILIRDSNRIVAAAVLESPKLTESEVEAFSLMKNVSEDVLRMIGAKREFVKNYTVIHNLVKNSRTPIGTSLTHLNRILTTDLKALSRNKNISEVLRKTAHRQLQIRTAPKESRY
jgi:hypothetical protein